MPLVASNLSSGLYPLFMDPPATAADCADAWGNAMFIYVAGIIPTSVNIVSASQLLKPLLTLAFSTNDAVAIENAFTLFAVSIAAGMVGYTSVAPAGSIGIKSMATQKGHSVAALAFALDVDTWMKTGTAAQITPPLPSIPWK